MKINKLETIEDLKYTFQSFNEPIYRYVYLHTGYNKEKAEDITQDVFIKAWEKRRFFNSRKSTLKNWIYTITRNHIIDIYRKNKNIDVSYDEKLQDTITKQSNELENEIAFLEIVRSLDKLKPSDKEVLVLRYIDNLEIKEISNIIGRNQIATKVMIHRAINKLKEIINKINE